MSGKIVTPKRTPKVTTDDDVTTDDGVTTSDRVMTDESVSTDGGVLVDADEHVDQHTDRVAEVARRAYELYAARGYEDGHDLEDWLAAEREV